MMNTISAFIARASADLRNLVIILFIACAAFQNPALAVQFETIATFNGNNGGNPLGDLVLDAAGNLYGTTEAGGNNENGTVFQLTPPALSQTAWTHKKVFTFNGTNGAHPAGRLVRDAAGNLYGTTYGGGFHGIGTVFQLTPPAPGKTAWTRKTLVNFNGTNGKMPMAGVVRDSAGNLYGTTKFGGKYNYGTVFQLTPPAPGKTAWTRKTLVNFNGPNGAEPLAGLVLDAAGNLYGTTSHGGKYFDGYPVATSGTVFQLTPPAPGQTAWTRKTLVNFKGTNGAFPMAGLVLDAAGKLYGTTAAGGNDYDSLGTVFQLTPPAPGQTTWTLNKLVDFNYTNGSTPEAGLVLDAAGNLYGTTISGGEHFRGTVFQVTPPVPAQGVWWTLTTLFSFLDDLNGANPAAGLVLDANANLYGTTYNNGASGVYNAGTVFKLTP